MIERKEWLELETVMLRTEERKENSRVNEFSRSATINSVSGNVRTKIKYMTSTEQESVSGTLIGFPEVSEKLTSIRFETQKRSEKNTEQRCLLLFPRSPC